jgi:hypothetical protein
VHSVGYSLFAILGTALFTGLFGVPAEEALLVQMALLIAGEEKLVDRALPRAAC